MYQSLQNAVAQDAVFKAIRSTRNIVQHCQDVLALNYHFQSADLLKTVIRNVEAKTIRTYHIIAVSQKH